MTIHFGNLQSLPTIAQAVPLYGGDEFESPTRSTIPMLTLLMHAPTMFDEIVRTLGFPSDYDLFLEYKVRPPRGRGNASNTDVMLKSGLGSLAIEAKWTESKYDTVKKWLRADKDSANRTAVLDGWLNLLSTHATTPLHAVDFDNVIYQMVHRAASAATAGQAPGMAYFLFKPSPDKRAAKPDDIFAKLTDLWDKLGKPKRFPFHMVEIEVKSTASYEPLRNSPKGKKATSKAVRAALQDSEPLFSFKAHVCRSVEG
jgi:hypothetical protein